MAMHAEEQLRGIERVKMLIRRSGLTRNDAMLFSVGWTHMVSDVGYSVLVPQRANFLRRPMKDKLIICRREESDESVLHDATADVQTGFRRLGLSTVQAMTHQPTPWLANVQSKPTEVLRLICFPYAGGSSIAYHNWSSFLPPGVAVYPVQLPGRGARWREKALTRMADVVSETLNGLRTNLTERFAFFGHSMGALIAFEVARRLAAEGSVCPEKLYVSGRKAPHFVEDQAGTYLLPDDEFVDRLRALNGTPAGVLDDPELLDLILPLVRADFELVQTYSFEASRRLDFPITAFGGVSDSHVSSSQLAGWAQQTTKEFAMKLLPGDHFFILHQKREFLRSLSSDLHDLLAPTILLAPTMEKRKHLASILS